MRAPLMVSLVRHARAEGIISTSALAARVRVSDRQVRHWLEEEAEESRPEQLHRLTAEMASPAERVRLVELYAQEIGAEVVLLPSRARASVLELADALAPHLRRAA